MIRFLNALSQLFNVLLLNGEPNESISGRCYREKWFTAVLIIDTLALWEVDHCRLSYENDLHWARQYIEQHENSVSPVYKK